ncbi:MAG: DUF1634 domain-containing protein [Phycisphaerales bacterium]|nr:DUF1634 domain-containing protein [Phycisphaerales bacterium]
MTNELQFLEHEAEYLRSRQLQLILRRIQRFLLWTIAITSITLICVGQGLAWSRGLSHAQIRGAVSTWHSLSDFIRAIGGGDASALMMVGIVCGIAMPFLRTIVVGVGFMLQRNWLHVWIALVVIGIMLMGLWVK